MITVIIINILDGSTAYIEYPRIHSVAVKITVKIINTPDGIYKQEYPWIHSVRGFVQRNWCSTQTVVKTTVIIITISDGFTAYTEYPRIRPVLHTNCC